MGIRKGREMGRNKILVILIAIIAIVGVAAISYNKYSALQKIYEQAIEEYNDENYSSAENLFTTLGEYKNSKEWLHVVEDRNKQEKEKRIKEAQKIETQKKAEKEENTYSDEEFEEAMVWISEQDLKKVDRNDIYTYIYSIENEKLAQQCAFYYRDLLKHGKSDIYSYTSEWKKRNSKAYKDLTGYELDEFANRTYSSEIRVEDKIPYIGMSEEELKKCSWSKELEKVNTTEYSFSTHKQYCYKGYRYVYVEDGIVTSIQK